MRLAKKIIRVVQEENCGRLTQELWTAGLWSEVRNCNLTRRTKVVDHVTQMSGLLGIGAGFCCCGNEHPGSLGGRAS
jgi:hypothetical protein